MNPIDLFPDGDRKNVAEKIQEGLANGKATLEANILTKSGKKIPF